MFLEYILTVHRDDLLKILSDNGLFNSYSINVDFLNLFEADPNTGDGVLCNPKHTLSKCDEDLIKAQQKIVEEESVRYTVKKNVRARFYGLPVCPELHRNTIPKNKDLGCFLKVTGTAVRVTQSKMLEYCKSYKCLKCQHIQLVEGKYEQRYVIKAPTKCNNPNMQCRSSVMSPVNAVMRENCKDYQELKIQEQVNKLSVGGIPGSIWVTLEDDLVDSCKPGDDVSICGIVMRRWNPVSLNKKCDVELVFKANHLEVCNAQKAIAVSIAPDVITDFNEFWSKYETSPMRGRDVLLASVCPKVYGLYMVKLALILTVITGSSHNMEREEPPSLNSTSVGGEEGRTGGGRAQCHLLLVGDPGTGKSQLLKAGALMTARSVLTSGSGSTKAGLTCTALREDGEWQLEAGALVLADGGACCIDELAQMREHDRASIHEAMEQQTISVAKAGIICKLNTRCAVIAACNPKGNYDTDQALSVNVSLGTPLLSRFDLIFILLDTLNQEWDKLVADYVLFGKTSESSIARWTLEKLQLYISLVGPYEVSISPDANTILKSYYVQQRRAEHRDPSRTTVRMLDSLVRLSQAHARLMFRHVVLPVDAVTAVSLMDLSMQDCTLADTSDALHSSFSTFPDFEYLKTAKTLLSSLNLYEIWHSELVYYSKLLNVDKQRLENDINRGETKYFPNISVYESSVDVENPSEIVESSYFKPSKVVESKEDNILPPKNDVVINEVTNSFLNMDKADDWDIILSLDDSKNKPDSLPCKNRQGAVSKNDLLPGNSKSVSDEVYNQILLAQSLRKHSSINKFVNVNSEGIITGKRKRVNNKSKEKPISSKKPKKTTSKITKIIDAPLQSILNQINHVQDKPKKNKSSTNSKPKNTNDNVILSNTDEEMSVTDVLKCLPSVNDVFNDISMEFDQDYDHDDHDSPLFENSQPSPDACQTKNNNLPSKTTIDLNVTTVAKSDFNISVSHSTDCKKLNNDVKNVDDEQIVVKDNERKTSPLNVKTMDKLKKFCFSNKNKNINDCVSEKLDNINFINNLEAGTSNSPLKNNNSVVNESVLVTKTNFVKNNDANIIKPSGLLNSQRSASSQISIFESDNDNFEALDF